MPTRKRTGPRSAHTRREKSREIAAEINHALGKDAISFASDEKFVVTSIPTGCLPVDVLLGGGIPRGRITELFGDFSTLKSWIALQAIARCQSTGGSAMLIDTEHSFDPAWAAQCGVNIDELVISHPLTGELAVDTMQMGLNRDIDLIVWDSIAATQPKQEAGVQLSGDKSIQPARLAALMSLAMRRLNTTNQKTAILCINQTRMKVGVVFGSPETTPGGKALSFFASHRVRFVKAGRITATRKSWDGEKNVTVRDTVAQKIRCELIKSKLSQPEREVWFVWSLADNRVDETGFLAAYALEHGWVEGSSPKTVARKLEVDKQLRNSLRTRALNG